MPQVDNHYPVWRLELYVRIVDELKWAPSDSVVCRRGSSSQVARLLRRWKRVEKILKRQHDAGAEQALAGIFPKSPYQATHGARLWLDEHLIEEILMVAEPKKKTPAHERRAR